MNARLMPMLFAMGFALPEVLKCLISGQTDDRRTRLMLGRGGASFLAEARSLGLVIVSIPHFLPADLHEMEFESCLSGQNG